VIGQDEGMLQTPPVTDEERETARQDFALRDREKEEGDGLSICEVDSARDEDHLLFVAATAGDRPFKKGGTKLDDDQVGVLVFTDDDLTGLGAPTSSATESCVLEVGRRHHILAWKQETLNALADLLLDRGKKARPFTRMEVRAALMCLKEEQIAGDDVWTYVHEHRTEWEEQARSQAERGEQDRKRKEAERGRRERQVRAEHKEPPPAAQPVAPVVVRDPPERAPDPMAVPAPPAPPPGPPVATERRFAVFGAAVGYVALALAIFIVIAWLLFR
jgi:hypothetical protein